MKRRLGTLLSSVVLLCVAMSGAATAQAAQSHEQPSREQVLKLMSAMGIQQSVDESLQQARIRVKDAARESFLKDNPTTDEATLKKLDDVFDSTPFFKFEDIVDVVIPVYQRNLSASDVQAGIEFYNSPAGKRLLEKVPEILRQSNEEGGKLVQTKMEAYGEALARKLTEFQAQLRNEGKLPPSGSAQSQSDGDSKKADEKSK
jgi:hypothetical protein